MLKKSFYFFMSVVETGSFSQAAKKHYLSQAAISQQISKLEEEVGVRLFDRSKYRPELTEAGKYYYQKIKQLSEEYEKIEKQTRYIQKKNSQKIVVGITGPFEYKNMNNNKKLVSSIFFFLLSLIANNKGIKNGNIINEYKEGHETHFDVRVYTFEEGKKLLEAGDIDIAFGLSSEFSVNPDISYETIHQSETCIVCSRKNRLSQYKSINPILVKDEPMITLSSQMGRKFYDDFMKAFILDGFEPNIVKEVNSLSEYFISIKLDEGIGYTGREVVPEEEDLCTVKIVGSHHHADFAVAYLKENKKQSVVQFYEYIVAYFKDYKKNL